jgi:hypothetical protein
MSSPDHVRELCRQSRLRLSAAGRMRTDYLLIRAETALRLAESRTLLDRADGVRTLA